LKILSIDTSSSICAVAILEDTNLIKEISLNNGLTHSEKLMPTINQIFKETNLSLKNIDLLVCDRGPGSFTGIRIGTSTIMAFADSLGIQSVGITSLEALAYNIKTNGIICSLIDAKNSNCYYGIYKLEHGKYNLLEDLCADHIDTILNKLEKYAESPITFVGNGSVVNKKYIEDKIPNCIFSNENDLCAYNLGLAGLYTYTNKVSNSILPLYLRKSQAERLLEGKNNAN
jgi:tRNA threonylcarbamoyladenosine biosynthesis protein TsaB